MSFDTPDGRCAVAFPTIPNDVTTGLSRSGSSTKTLDRQTVSMCGSRRKAHLQLPDKTRQGEPIHWERTHDLLDPAADWTDALPAVENHKPSQSSNAETWPCTHSSLRSPSSLAPGLDVCIMFSTSGPIRLAALQSAEGLLRWCQVVVSFAGWLAFGQQLLDQS